MTKLTIKDLARTEQLDRSKMAAVRGGHKMSAPSMLFPPSVYSPSSDSSVDAKQNLQQFQQVINSTADGSAFIDGVHVTNTTSQFGQNNLLVA